jgi:probable F420-dependent oxidoreductase
MRFGIRLYWGGMKAECMGEVARRAEECGYESAWIWDHLVYPKDINSPYPYSPDHAAPIATTRALDPWICLGHVAAVTSKIRLGTFIYILPLRNPFVTARSVLTVDVLSKGRVMLGAGIGWMKEEYDIVGEDFASRGHRAEEITRILKALWTEDEPEFHGRFYDFAPVKFDPKPVQKPYPPIHFGGETEIAMRRAAKFANGWMGASTDETFESASAKIRRLRALLEEAGREKESFEITLNTGSLPDLETVRRWEEVGVTRLVVAPWLAEASLQGINSAMAEAREKGPQGILEFILSGTERYADQVLAKVSG